MTEQHWANSFYAGKTVVITGGTGGIGLGLSTAFRDAGASVHATGATEAESPESKRIVEDLTGWKWERLWGRG